MRVAVPVRHLRRAVQLQHVARRVVAGDGAARLHRHAGVPADLDGRVRPRRGRCGRRRRGRRSLSRSPPPRSRGDRRTSPTAPVAIEHRRQLLDVERDEIGGILGDIGIGSRTQRRRDRRHSARGSKPGWSGDRRRGLRSASGGNRSAGCRATSAKVHTAATPGSARAAPASIRRCRPCAIGERTTRM